MNCDSDRITIHFPAQSFSQGKEISYWTITYDLNRSTNWSHVTFLLLAHLGSRSSYKITVRKANSNPFLTLHFQSCRSNKIILQLQDNRDLQRQPSEPVVQFFLMKVKVFSQCMASMQLLLLLHNRISGLPDSLPPSPQFDSQIPFTIVFCSGSY